MSQNYKIAIYVDSNIVNKLKKESASKKQSFKSIINAAIIESFKTENITKLLEIKRESNRSEMQRIFFCPDENTYELFYGFLNELNVTDKKVTATFLLNVILNEYSNQIVTSKNKGLKKNSSKKNGIHLRLSSEVIEKIKSEQNNLVKFSPLGDLIEEILFNESLNQFVPSKRQRTGKVKVTLSADLLEILMIMKIRTNSSIAEIIENVLVNHYEI